MDIQSALARLKSTLPRWFGGSETPLLDGLLTGPSWSFSRIKSLLDYVSNQMRIGTATGINLDIIANDFLGLRILRRKSQPDTDFRAIIKAEIMRERGTRPGIIKAVEDLTGKTPRFFEPRNPRDTGGYGVKGAMGYGMAGRYGSLRLPFQAFIVVFKPPGAGVPDVGGYGNTVGGLRVGGQLEYVSKYMIEGAVTDADIYAMISATKSAGTVIWVHIATLDPEAFLDHNAVLDAALTS